MKFLYLLLIVVSSSSWLNAGLKKLTLPRALSILEKSNLEIKASKFEESMKYYDHIAAKAKKYGTLDLEYTALRSNDAGNVFGFKLQSREANFGDFGFSDFMNALGEGIMQSAQLDPNGLPNFGFFALGLAQNSDAILALEPADLNYPAPRNHFITKMTYKVPLYTGGMLKSYRKITKKMYEMSKLDTKKLFSLKRYELKKTFYDIAVVNNFIYNLNVIKRNIQRLKAVIKEMKKEGYALETDILEVDARLAEVEAMLNEARLNRELAYYFLSFLLNKKVDSVVAPKRDPRVPRVTKKIIEERSLDIAKAKMGLSITKDAIRVEKAKFKPQVGAFVEYGFADNRVVPISMKKDFWTIGMQAKMNVYNGGADRAMLEKAKANYLKVKSQLELAKKGLWLKAQKLKAEIRSLNYRVRSFKKQYIVATKVYKTYREKYKEGLVSITELLIKQSKQIEILLKLLKVKNDRNAKILALQDLINK
ncbi:MAG: TolC family protein [Epsilonproteobacteria bacterium]|nr:TolC family protein [Campylobacterota bacterium]